MALDDGRFELGAPLQLPFRARNPLAIQSIAEELELANSAHVVDQHVVSQVLLKQFSCSVKGSPKVVSYKICTGTSRATSLASAGMVPNFLLVASGSAEVLWQSVENHMGPALATAADEQGVLTSEQSLVIKDAIALHYARSEAVKQLGDKLYVELKKNFTLGLARALKAELQSIFYSRFGFLAGSFETLQREVVYPMLEGTDELVLSGRWRRVRMQQLFEDARAAIRSANLTLLVSRHTDLIIGDVPVVARKRDSQRIGGILAGIPLADADQLFFPLGPHHAVCLTKDNNKIDLSHEEAAELNGFQLSTALQRVFYRPGTGIEEKLRVGRPPTEGPHATSG